MEAVSKTGWLADVLLEIAGMSLAASPTEGVSPLVLRFRAFVCFPFLHHDGGREGVCLRKGVG